MESSCSTRAPIARPSVVWSRGVTLVELLVVLGIILILSLVVITSHANFNKTILLTSTAYDVALTIRSAQAYGLGTRSEETIASGGSNFGYGVHFDYDSNQFILFADTELPSATNCHGQGPVGADAPDAIRGNCVYNSGVDTIIRTYQLGNGMKIQSVSIYPSPTTWRNYTNVDVVFSRPNTRAFFAANKSYRLNTTKARLTLSSPQGTLSYVCINLTGEIRVANTDTC